MMGYLNHIVADSMVADRHRAADRSRTAAAARLKPTRQRHGLALRVNRMWLGLRRRPELA
jgi:hypothetical protein